MRAIEHLKTVCCLGLPPASAMMALTPLLHEIIAHRWTRFSVFAPGGATIDPYRGRDTGALEMPSPAQVWIAERQAVGICWDLHTQAQGWLDSPCHCKIEAPLDSRWVLGAAVGESGRTYATMELTRPRSEPPFAANDVKRLNLLRPWLARALESPFLAAVAEGDEERLGMVGLPLLSGQMIVTAGGDVVHQTRNAKNLLVTLEAGRRRGPTLPPPITKLVQRIVSLRDPPRRTRVWSPCGIHTVDAKWLFPADATPTDVAKDPKGCLIAVSIELHEHPVAHAARVLRMRGATPAQVNVGIKLALGKTKPKIANELGVKDSSITDLTRKLYQTLDVHNSAELAAQIWLSATQQSAPSGGVKVREAPRHALSLAKLYTARG